MAKPNHIIPVFTEKQTIAFWANISVLSSDECWEWKSNTDTNGYGQLSLDGIKRKTFRAHRIAYFLHYNEQPRELLVCHTCDNKPCCNPAHLWLGTTQDNRADCVKKGRQAKGDKMGRRLHPECYDSLKGDGHWTRRLPENVTRGSEHLWAKLTEVQVLEIRARHAEGNITLYRLGKEYGIERSAIRKIVKRIVWKHI